MQRTITAVAALGEHCEAAIDGGGRRPSHATTPSYHPGWRVGLCSMLLIFTGESSYTVFFFVLKCFIFVERIVPNNCNMWVDSIKRTSAGGAPIGLR